MAACIVNLSALANDKKVKPHEQMKGIAEIKPGTVVYLSAAVPTRLAQRQSVGNMERGRLSGNAAPLQTLNKSKIIMENFSSVATVKG